MPPDPRVRPALLALLLLLLGAGPATAQQTTPALTPALATETFDAVWTRIADTHYDPELRGVDWDAVRDELRPRARDAASMAELRSALREMLDRLGESHFAILEGEAAESFGGEPGGPGDADPGLTLRLLEDDVVVTSVRPDGSAAREGVAPGWVLVGVGDLEASTLSEELSLALAGREDADRLLPLYLPSLLEARLQGPEGSHVEARFRDGSGESVVRSLLREEPAGTRVTFGNLGGIRVDVSSRAVELPSGGGGQAGLIAFSSWFPVVVPAIAEAVDAFRDAPGLVIDLRGNPGGVGGLVMGIAGHLLDERVDLGELTTRDQSLRFAVNPQLVAPDGSRVSPYGGPVAILVDGLSASTSEIFAGGLQSLGRVRIFGTLTPGQALPALIVPLPNGDRLMHAIADYTLPDGSRLEGRGVRPDVTVPLTRAALLEGRDPALEAALRWIESTAAAGFEPAPTDP